MIRKARDANARTHISYGDLMDDLGTAWRITDSPDEPASDDGCRVHIKNYVFDELEALGLSKPVPQPEPKHPGRPKKAEEIDPDKPKRPRGRPRKNPPI